VTNPAWGSNGEDVYRRTYQRTKSNGEHETWLDTVTRVVDGNLALVDPKHTEPGERETLIDHIYNFKLIPAGRHLWASGVKGRQYLFNCFRAGTLVHTQTGVVPIEKLSGQTVDVLSEGGVYRPAKFDSYGEQALYKVTLARGEEFFATADHQWVIMQPDGPRRVPTVRLANKRVPFNPAPRPDETPDYFEGLAHGIVYGDGTRSGASSTMISLFGAKRELEILLLPFSRRGSVEHPDRVYVGTLPREWKDLPGERASRSYWRGFINGLIATDGTVLSGSVLLDQSSAEALAEIRIGAMWAGFVPTQVRMTRTHNPYNGEYAPSFRLTLRGWSVQKEDLVRFDQRSKFHPRTADTRTTRVVSVEPTGIVEEVFCAVEPETHTITVGSGILTGQCHVSGWGNTLSEHAMFTFLRLMEGGGVGANYSLRYLRGYSSLNELRVHVVCDDRHPDYQAMLEQGLLSTKFVSDWDGAYQVDDSREGWANALGDLLDTYARDDVQHTDRVYDVSNVRGAGARLKTFGGTASGPAPFARMLLKVADVMNKVSDSIQVMPLDAMAIDHAVAECVVSGGNRRSARMSIVHWQDPQVFEFIRCKEDTGEHWSTNISVEIDNEFLAALADPTHDKFSPANWVMQEVTAGMLRNGEPGLWNSSLSNVGEPNEVICTNPCLTGDTVIATLDGPRTFADLAEDGRDVEVYSWDPKTKRPVVRWMRRPHLTRENAEILKVTFDSGLVVRCTPDHSFYSFRGKKVQAKNIRIGQSIRAFSASRDGSGHERVHGWDSKRNAADHQWTHRMIWENEHGPIEEGMQIAHLDHDAYNNDLTNLAAMTPYEHASYDYPLRKAAGFNGHSPNHKVVSVEYAGHEDVYNGMVEGSHTYIVLDPTPIAGHMSGIVSANCGEIALEEFENCNLGHVNLGAFVHGDDLENAHRLMARFLLRATFGDVNDPRQAAVLARNRRIGVGHLGVQAYLALRGIRYSEAPNLVRFRKLLTELRAATRKAADEYAFLLRIPAPVKVTTVAPTGSIAKLPGTTEGIHPIYARYFIRRIRYSTVDPRQSARIEEFRSQGYHVEDDVSVANTAVVSFPTKESLVAEVEAMGLPADLVESSDELTVSQLLEFQALYQECYADNAVSFTVNVLDGSITREELVATLVDVLPRLKGTTVFPDKTRPQSPYERISQAEYELAEYALVGDGTDEECANGACPVR
jgi:ribonucleotide reductase alpha subunit